jgi:hypothetical protein
MNKRQFVSAIIFTLVLSLCSTASTATRTVVIHVKGMTCGGCAISIEQTLKVAYHKALKMNELAWDVYYVYGRGAEWTGDLPPAPDYYMHQLRSLPPDRMLDGTKLAEEMNKLLQ